MKKYPRALNIASLVTLLALNACDPFTDQVRDVAPDSTTDITLRRVLKQRRFYSCEGDLISDRIEEISRANALINIHPRANSSLIYNSSFHNRTTGDNSYAGSGLNGVYIDISPSSLAMHVKQGTNVIGYRFTQCLEKSVDPVTQYEVCKDERTLEEGSIQLNITYIEETMPGVDEHHYSCPEPTPSPAPTPTP